MKHFYIARIFSWYAGDFVLEADSVEAFVARYRESIEVRESSRVLLGNIQKQSVFLVEYRGSLGDIP